MAVPDVPRSEQAQGSPDPSGRDPETQDMAVWCYEQWQAFAVCHLCCSTLAPALLDNPAIVPGVTCRNTPSQAEEGAPSKRHD